MPLLSQRFFQGFLWNQGIKILELGLSFASSVILARGLGVNDYGLLVSVVTVISLISFFTSFGFEEILNYYIPKLSVSEGEKNANFLLRILVILRALIYGVTIGLIFIFNKNIADILGFPAISVYLKIASLYFFFGGVASLFLANFFGRLLVKEVAVVRVLSSVIGLILTIVVLFVLRLGLSGQLWAMTLSSFFTLTLYLWSSLKYLKNATLSIALRPLLGFGLTIWLTNLVNYILGKQFDILVLGHFLKDAKTLGFYSLAFSIIAILGTLMTMGAAGVSSATFSEIAQKKEWDKLRLALRVHIKLDSFLLIPPVIFALFFGRQIISIIYGSSYSSAFQFLVIFGFFNILSRPLGGGTTTSVLYALNLERLVMFLRGGAGILNIILALFFLITLNLGATGVALATGFVGLFLGILEFLALFYKFKPSVPVFYHLKLIIAITSGLAVVFWINPTNLLVLVLTALVFALFTFLVLLFLKPIEREELPLLEKVLPAFAVKSLKLIHIWKIMPIMHEI